MLREPLPFAPPRATLRPFYSTVNHLSPLCALLWRLAVSDEPRRWIGALAIVDGVVRRVDRQADSALRPRSRRVESRPRSSSRRRRAPFSTDEQTLGPQISEGPSAVAAKGHACAQRSAKTSGSLATSARSPHCPVSTEVIERARSSRCAASPGVWACARSASGKRPVLRSSSSRSDAR